MSATAFLEGQLNENPDLFEHMQKFGELYDRRQWHQLTDAIESFIQVPENSRNGNFILMYNMFIRHFESKINQLRLAYILCKIAKQFSDAQEAESFLRPYLDKKGRIGEEAFCYFMSEITMILTALGKLDEAKAMLEDSKKTLDEISTADPIVHAHYYRAGTEYFKCSGPPSSFFSHGILFLTYAPMDSLTELEKQSLSIDLALAAIVGENVFNFGEIVLNPIIVSLDSSPNAWLKAMLEAFNRGDIDSFNTIVDQNEAQITEQPALVVGMDYAKQKLVLMSLLNIIFQRNASDRIIPFLDIAQAAKIPLDQVEWVIMKALSLGLIKGEIDQVDQVVHVTWTQPRILDATQLSQMAEKIEDWTNHVQQTLLFVEQQTPELF